MQKQRTEGQLRIKRLRPQESFDVQPVLQLSFELLQLYNRLRN